MGADAGDSGAMEAIWRDKDIRREVADKLGLKVITSLIRLWSIGCPVVPEETGNSRPPRPLQRNCTEHSGQTRALASTLFTLDLASRAALHKQSELL